MCKIHIRYVLILKKVTTRMHIIEISNTIHTHTSKIPFTSICVLFILTFNKRILNEKPISIFVLRDSIRKGMHA